MSFEVTTAFVKQYHSVVEMLVQQKGSRLRSCVRNEGQNSEEQFWDQIGPTEVQEITNRHGDSPLVSTHHDRRAVSLRFFDWGDLIDNIDKVQMLIDPANPYTQNAVAAMGRKMDDIILSAMFADARTGKTGSTLVPFPAAQQIAAAFGGAASGLTITKLIEARRLMLAANVDGDVSQDLGEEAYIGVTAKQIANLLATTQVTNSDYNTIKALVAGQVNSYMGFSFKHTERVLLDGSNNRRVPAWVASGLLFAVNPNISATVVQRWDKRGSWYPYVKAGFGGVRMQEPKIVEIKCDETV